MPASARAAVRTFWDLNREIRDPRAPTSDEWRAALLRAQQELRAARRAAPAGAVSATPAPTESATPSGLAARGETPEISLDERRVRALEAIATALSPVAEAARLYLVSKNTACISYVSAANYLFRAATSPRRSWRRIWSWWSGSWSWESWQSNMALVKGARVRKLHN